MPSCATDHLVATVSLGTTWHGVQGWHLALCTTKWKIESWQSRDSRIVLPSLATCTSRDDGWWRFSRHFKTQFLYSSGFESRCWNCCFLLFSCFQVMMAICMTLWNAVICRPAGVAGRQKVNRFLSQRSGPKFGPDLSFKGLSAFDRTAKAWR